MDTLRNCTTPRQGWSYYHHFLGNILNLIPLIAMQEKYQAEENRKKMIHIIDDLWATLVGNLYLVRRRMVSNAHIEEANKMQIIIDMVVEWDVTDKKVCKRIHDKTKELSSTM